MSPLPNREESTSAPGSVQELVDQEIAITAVAEIDGVPIVEVEGRWYLCTGDWASRGARYLEGEFESSGRKSIKVKVVEQGDEIGFQEP